MTLFAWLAPRDPAWCEAIAVGLYLHLRPGELHELRVKDLDLASREVRICRAYDDRKDVVTTPKTDEGIRRVSIPDTLLPLLERIASERGAEDRVCPIIAETPSKKHPTILRDFLEAAGIDAPEFFVETATHLMIDFRSLRDAGITWRFLAGERAEVVQREAGHEDINITLGYAKEVQDRQGRYGETSGREGRCVSARFPRGAFPSALRGTSISTEIFLRRDGERAAALHRAHHGDVSR